MEFKYDKLPCFHVVLLQGDILSNIPIYSNPFNDNGKTRIFEVLDYKPNELLVGFMSKRVALKYNDYVLRQIILESYLICLN